MTKLRLLEFALEFIVTYAIYFVLMVSTKVLSLEELIILGVGSSATIVLKTAVKGMREFKSWSKRLEKKKGDRVNVSQRR